MDTDFLLIQKIRNGNEDAINTFVHKYYPSILKYCRIHINDYWFAENLTQESFVSFFNNINQYQHYGKALNYLYVIAANKCKDFYKKKHEIVLDELPEQIEFNMEKINNWIDVHLALSKLSNDMREVAILYFIQGLKQKEIAKVIGIGLPLVKYRVKIARKLLCEYLKEGGNL